MNTNLAVINKLVYQPCGFTISHFKAEPESKIYSACDFRLNNMPVKFRMAKITPTKVGQFVTTWKRDEHGKTVPFDVNDHFDVLVIGAINGEQIGQFVFTKQTLIENGVIKSNNSTGKCGIRVYPTWDQVNNKQAQHTQQWQSQHFFDFTNGANLNQFKKHVEDLCLNKPTPLR